MIRSFDGMSPAIADSAYVAESATIIGNVEIEENASIWPGVVLRGDSGEIVVQEGSNIQDNATLHEEVNIGPYATVAHNAVVHAATIGRRSMVGMGAIVLDGSHIGEKSIVGANSLVLEHTEIPDSVLAVGNPAEVVKKIEDSKWATTGDRYVEKARRHRETSEIINHTTKE